VAINFCWCNVSGLIRDLNST